MSSVRKVYLCAAHRTHSPRMSRASMIMSSFGLSEGDENVVEEKRLIEVET